MVERVRAPAEAVGQYRDSTDPAALPRVSTVVPVYADPEGVRDTVRSLEAASYPDRELLVVVTPSDGETRAVLDELEATVDCLTVLVEEEYETPGSARNVGIERATGDVVAFVDADMRVEADYLWSLAYLFEETGVDYLGYPVQVGRDGNVDGVVARYDSNLRFPNETLMRRVDFSPTCALAVRDGVLEAGHRFEPSMDGSEDVVFGQRVLADGFAFGYCPDVDVDHPVRDSLGAVLAKGVKDGRGWYQMYTFFEETYFHPRSRLLMSRAFRPMPYLSEACEGWDSMPAREKAAMATLSLLESLAATYGWVLESVAGDRQREPWD